MSRNDPAVLILFCHLIAFDSSCNEYVEAYCRDRNCSIPFAVNVMMLRAVNLRSLSTWRMTSAVFDAGLCENTQVTFAVYRDASSDMAAANMLPTCDYSSEYVTKAQPIITLGDVELGQQYLPQHDHIYFSHLPSRAMIDEQRMTPMQILDQLHETFNQMCNRVRDVLAYARHHVDGCGGFTTDRCYMHLYHQILKWIREENPTLQSPPTIPPFLESASWCLKTMYLFQNHYTDLRVSLSDGQHRIMLFMLYMAGLQVRWLDRPPYRILVIPDPLFDQQNRCLPDIPMSQLIMVPKENEGIQDFTQRCYQQAERTDRQTASAVAREPVHE
jgi:hypothetical protein